MARFLLLSDSCGFVDVGRYLWREDGSVVYNCSWPSPAQSFSGPSPMGLVIIFYCFRLKTSLFIASYDSQGYGGGIRPSLHTGASLFWPVAQYFKTSTRTKYRTPFQSVPTRISVVTVLFQRTSNSSNKIIAKMRLASCCPATNVYYL
jgi:hypothetical protein